MRFCNKICMGILSAFLTGAPAGAVTGKVINKTLNRPEAEVVVSFVQHVGNNVTVLRDTTNAGGEFTLEVPVDLKADPPPMLFAKYLNVDYPGQITDQAIEIPVYETTSADTAVSMMSQHILVNATTRDVTYILIPQNSSNRTYLSEGDHGHGLEMTLPDGVTELLQAPQGMHLHGTVVVDPRPIMPGNGQTFFTFALPASNQLSQHITYPTSSLDVLIQPAETEVTIAGLQDQGTVTLGPDVFRRFSGINLVPGTHIGVTIGSGEAVSQETLIWILAGLAIVFGGFAVVVARRPRQVSVPNHNTNRRTVLLEQIADLDDRFENEELTEADYQSRRNALKAEVADLSSNRQAILEQIADLDEQFEKGKITEEQYRKQRIALKKQAGTSR